MTSGYIAEITCKRSFWLRPTQWKVVKIARKSSKGCVIFKTSSSSLSHFNTCVSNDCSCSEMGFPAKWTFLFTRCWECVAQTSQRLNASLHQELRRVAGVHRFFLPMKIINSCVVCILSFGLSTVRVMTQLFRAVWLQQRSTSKLLVRRNFATRQIDTTVYPIFSCIFL